MAVAIFMKPGANFFFKLDAFIIVMGGTVAATLAQFPLKDFLGVMNVTQKAFLHKAVSTDALIEKLIELSRRARVEGLLSLEKDINEMDDAFMKKALQLMVDGTEMDVLRILMHTELDYLEERHELGQSIFKSMAAYAPAFGMVGTLIGLIQMLQSLSDPSKIGAGMAVALVTTLYGVVFANLVFMPIAGKLKERSKQEILTRQLAIEGICSIQAGDNPRLLKDKLLTFLAPKERNESIGES
jgi:chemotaxis protein MotA